MPKTTARYLAVFLLAITSLSTATASTEIYKWVDADGNVHFGDKPQEPEKAANAKPVELSTGYQPAQRTEEEQEAFEREQRSILEKSKENRDIVERQQQRDYQKAQAKSQQDKAELCAAYDSEIKRLSSRQMINGRAQLTFLVADDGKPLTAQRQREIVEELKTDMAAAGC